MFFSLHYGVFFLLGISAELVHVHKGKSFAKWCQWNILPKNEGAFLWEIRPLQIRFHLVRPKDRKTCWRMLGVGSWTSSASLVMRSFLFTSYSILWRALGSKMGVCIGQMIAITGHNCERRSKQSGSTAERKSCTRRRPLETQLWSKLFAQWKHVTLAKLRRQATIQVTRERCSKHNGRGTQWKELRHHGAQKCILDSYRDLSWGINI